MTLYYSGVKDGRGAATEGLRQIIENHPEYAEGAVVNGELVINISEMHEKKIRSLLDVVESTIEDSDAYRMVESPSIEYVPKNERDSNE